jgi:hypothetical protein
MEAPAGPYRGLDFFREQDQHLFFGRDADCKRIVGNLGAARLTLLYAESGVGKSSLLRAGVAAPLRGRRKLYVPVVFSEWTGGAVTQRLLDAVDASVQHFLGEPAGKPQRFDTLEDALMDAAGRTDATPVVILDQFEDHLLYDSTDTKQFDKALAACINRRDLPANFLISIRQDAYSEIGNRFKASIPNVYANYLHLDFLDERAARDAAKLPPQAYAERNGDGRRAVDVDDALLDELLAQLRRLRHDIEEGARKSADRDLRTGVETGYLQLVLQRIWADERTQQSRVMKLETLQSLGGAKKIIQSRLDQVMETLERPQRDVLADAFRGLVTSTGRKIPLTTKEISGITEASPEELEPLLLQLDKERVLRTVPASDPGGDERREIFHDVLATAILDWRRRWVEKRVRDAANRRTAAIVAVAAVLISLAAWALVSQGKVTSATNRATALTFNSLSTRHLATRPDVALQLAFDSYRESESVDAKGLLLSSFAAVATPGTTAVLTGPTDYVTGVAFTPDGGQVAASSADRRIRVWNTGTHKLVADFRGHGDGVTGIAISRDGHTLASSSTDGTVRLWDLREPTRPARVMRAATNINALAFSPDGRTLAGGGYKVVQLFDPIKAQPGRRLKLHSDWVTSVAFSADGHTLASASSDKTVALWDLVEQVELPGVEAPTSLNSVALSPDGRTLAMADNATSIWLIDLRRGRVIGSALTGDFQTTQVAFSPDGKVLAAASYKSVHMYDTHRSASTSAGTPVGSTTSPSARTAGRWPPEAPTRPCASTTSTRRRARGQSNRPSRYGRSHSVPPAAASHPVEQTGASASGTSRTTARSGTPCSPEAAWRTGWPSTRPGNGSHPGTVTERSASGTSTSSVRWAAA